MTFRELLAGSLRLLGVLAEGETPTASQTADGLSAANRMLDAWSAQNLLCDVTVREEFALTPSQPSRTIGVGGNFNTSRPSFIERAYIEDQSVTPTQEYPLDVITDVEWAAIPRKDETAAIPRRMHASGSFPLETLYFFPVPTVAHKVVLYSKKPLTAIASANTSISFPPGWEEAFVYNLARRQGPEYGKSLSPEALDTAVDSLAIIKRKNIKPKYLGCDPALLRNGTFDINTGE